jgi:hypothetical protein
MNTEDLSLEKTLETLEDNLESRRAALSKLIQSRVVVMLDTAWDGTSLPSTSMRLLHVSDGGNERQPMLALFTSEARTAEFRKDESPFRYAVEVDAAWALLGVPEGAGIMINPNTAPGFRITPELAAQLRALSEKHLAGRIQAAAKARPL